MSEYQDNGVNWITGDKVIYVSLTDRKFIRKVRDLAKEIGANLEENQDGSICCCLPLECLKFSKKRRVDYSDEQRAAAADRLKKAREKKGKPNGG